MNDGKRLINNDHIYSKLSRNRDLKFFKPGLLSIRAALTIKIFYNSLTLMFQPSLNSKHERKHSLNIKVVLTEFGSKLSEQLCL